jgi:hypothetical protein
VLTHLHETRNYEDIARNPGFKSSEVIDPSKKPLRMLDWLRVVVDTNAETVNEETPAIPGGCTPED